MTEPKPNQITLTDIENAIACEVYVGGANLADSMRFLWLTEDLDSLEERIARGRLVETMATKSTAAMRQDIDANASIGPAVHAIGSAFGTVTLCLMVLQNGTKIVGVNYGPVDKANYDPEKGRIYAREDAIRQIWPLLGYELRSRMVAAS